MGAALQRSEIGGWRLGSGVGQRESAAELADQLLDPIGQAAGHVEPLEVLAVAADEAVNGKESLADR